MSSITVQYEVFLVVSSILALVVSSITVQYEVFLVVSSILASSGSVIYYCVI